LFFEDIPAVVSASLVFCYLDESELKTFIETMEDADAIRQALPKRGLAAFLAAGDTIDVAGDMAIEMETPNAGRIRGVGIPNGITLIIGDRNSGRSELVRALATGVYNHVPGARLGRVVTVSDAVEIVAEPGRSVQRVDLRPFLRDGAGGSALLSTGCADAVESQMASVVEAFQSGSQTLLLDEAFSAPDFLSADARLSGLPLSTPRRFAALSERVRRFADEGRITWVIGADACAAQFIPVADLVLLIESGRIRDVTKEARTLGVEPVRSADRAPAAWVDVPRWIFPSSIDPAFGREDARIDAQTPHLLRFGQTEIDLRGVSQLAETHQTRTIGLLLYYAKLHYLDESRTVAEILDMLDEDIAREGLDSITREVRGDLARPRRFEIAAALNRLEPLRVATRSGTPPAA
jgi:predicted ABC-class ATPase